MEGLDLSAQLVALSACNTAGATDRALEGEGFAGLTRAFMYAGARGLLVSHWAVETRATRELMTAVFGALSAGIAPAEALSRAQARLRASAFGPDDLRVSRSHPFFWAPFVYVGD